MALSKITADSITSNVITSALIADGQITFADIANNSITGDKLASGISLTNPVASIANGTAYTTSSVGNILTVQNTTANGYAGIQFNTEPSVGNAGQAAINSFAPATGDSVLAFSTRKAATLTEKLRINESGNVGIGTISPTGGKLHISHGNDFAIYTLGSYNFQAKFESSDPEAAIVIEDSNSTNDGNRIGVIGDDMTFTTANAERFRIGSVGQLGIGGATYGTSGQVLTSGGANAAPTWANTSSSSSGTSIGLVRAIAINCILC